MTQEGGWESVCLEETAPGAGTLQMASDGVQGFLRRLVTFDPLSLQNTSHQSPKCHRASTPQPGGPFPGNPISVLTSLECRCPKRTEKTSLKSRKNAAINAENILKAT